MKKTKFGGLQKLRAGYMDGRLSVEGEIMKNMLEISISMIMTT